MSCLLSTTVLCGQVNLVSDEKGHRLTVDGTDFMINGMNWDYIPVGSNYSYPFWKQSDDFIKAALESEMTLLRAMGVNAIRHYTGIPAKWITYIYDNYGIYTMLNHPFGRYGLTIEGRPMPNTEYGDRQVKKFLISQVKDLAKKYKNTRGLLLYLLGNENNYGLSWEGAETEDIPEEDKMLAKRARSMYALFDKAAKTMKCIDPDHPIAICNGDLQYLDIINEECSNVDILGTNMYRGISFTDAFESVNNIGYPILFTELGADAYNAIENEEDQISQARYFLANWIEIYLNAAGQQKSQNCIGGFSFQFSDGWWKFGQTINLDVHDSNASWSNAGYIEDYSQSAPNMNEEWFGICAKSQTDDRGLYSLTPRLSYYVLKEVHRIDPFQKRISNPELKIEFDRIQNSFPDLLKALGYE